MSNAAVTIRIVTDIGEVKNTLGSPWLIDERAAELRFGERAEDQADHRRRDREAPAPHREAEQAEDVQRQQVDHRLVQAVGAQRREDQDAGVEQRLAESSAP